jgi:hypothetical protein
MISVLLAMLLSVGLALAVLGIVAVPARRSGRELLTERGEQLAGSLRRRAPVGVAAAGPSTAPTPAAASPSGH